MQFSAVHVNHHDFHLRPYWNAILSRFIYDSIVSNKLLLCSSFVSRFDIKISLKVLNKRHVLYDYKSFSVIIYNFSIIVIFQFISIWFLLIWLFFSGELETTCMPASYVSKGLLDFTMDYGWEGGRSLSEELLPRILCDIKEVDGISFSPPQ